jgi:hypothetical protein
MENVNMRRIVNTAVLALSALLILGCSAREATSSRTPEEAAQALADLALELGSLERALDRATTSAWEATEDPLTLELGREPSDDERDWVRGMLRATLAEYLTGDVWREAVTRVYGERFTAAELDQLIEFYRSPLGRKVLSGASELAREVDGAMRERIDAKVEEFITRVDTQLAERFEELGDGS